MSDDEGKLIGHTIYNSTEQTVRYERVAAHPQPGAARCPQCLSDSRKEGNMVPCVNSWHTEAAQLPQPDADPISMTLHCPRCRALHVDEGEWATRPHKTHQCQSCGLEWRPFDYVTVGVAAPQPSAPVRTAEEIAQGFGLTERALKDGEYCDIPNRDVVLAIRAYAAQFPRLASEELARKFHETYERLAPQFGYETRKESAKPWEQVPEQNRKLMIAVCAEIAAQFPQAEQLQKRVQELERHCSNFSAAIMEYENKEASVCPEDVGFVEFIGVLQKRAESAERYLAVAVRTLRKGIDDDDTYMRSVAETLKLHNENFIQRGSHVIVELLRRQAALLARMEEKL